MLLATYGTRRFGELFGLQRSDVDLALRMVRVERQATHLADGTIVIGPPKSDVGRRAVSLPSSLIAELDRRLAAYVGHEPEAWVFRSPTGVVPRKSNWSVYWRKVTAAVGI